MKENNKRSWGKWKIANKQRTKETKSHAIKAPIGPSKEKKRRAAKNELSRFIKSCSRLGFLAETKAKTDASYEQKPFHYPKT